MNIKHNIIFSLESRKKHGIPIVDNVPIRMRVTYTRNRIEFTTGYRIDASKWDDVKQRVRNGCSNKLKQTAADINANLNDYATTIRAIFKEFEVQGVVPTPKQLKELFSGRCGDKDKKLPVGVSLFTVFDEFTREMGNLNNWSKATYIKFQNVRNHLEFYNANLAFSDLNEAGLSEYVNYLRDIKDMRNTTINWKTRRN